MREVDILRTPTALRLLQLWRESGKAAEEPVERALHYENMNEITPAADGSYLLAAGSYRVKLMPDQETVKAFLIFA